MNLFPTAIDSVLVVVDAQERLLAAMRPEDKAQVERNVPILLRAAELVGVPVLVTEQYPKGLGHTSPIVKEAIPAGTPVVEKVVFSCGRSDEFRSLLEQSGRRTVILTGMETHVCVLQTAFDLIDRGYSVHVASDAVCSRTPENRAVGLELLRQKGAAITSTETVAFQWVGQAGTDTFKAISKLVK